MKVGLVLAGGGARGAYEIGVWKALIELGIDMYINVVSGASIGALNSILFINGDIEFAERLWGTLSDEEILKANSTELSIKKILLKLGMKNIEFIKKYTPTIITGGKISRDGICKLIDDVDLSCIYSKDIRCYVACTQIPECKIKYFKINEYEEETVKQILLASSAIPMIFDNVDIQGNEYLDAGIAENEPIQPVYGEACDLIIVVHLEKGKHIDRNMYPNTNIVEITPSIIEKGDFDGVLEFNSNIIMSKIDMGYQDTINTIKPIMDLTKYMLNDNGHRNSIFRRIKNEINDRKERKF